MKTEQYQSNDGLIFCWSEGESIENKEEILKRNPTLRLYLTAYTKDDGGMVYHRLGGPAIEYGPDWGGEAAWWIDGKRIE
jgi:hypothetical protein